MYNFSSDFIYLSHFRIEYPIPIILQDDDVRRSYPKLFDKILNSSDPDFISIALTKYCTPNCVCLKDFVGI